MIRVTDNASPAKIKDISISIQQVQQTAYTTEIVAPSNLQARLSNNNVILSWNLGDVINTVTTGAVYENKITGNAGFFDSIANFFKNLFGIGTRGTALPQLVYDVWRKEGSGAYNVLEQSVPCSVTRDTCTYTDTTAQQGKTYTYKVGVRASTEAFSGTSVKFSNEASINIPAAGQPTYGVLDFNKDGRVDITVSGSDLLGSDGTLFTQHFETITSSSNWDAAYDLNADGKVDFDDFLVLADLLPSEGQAALTDITVNVASTLNVGGRATATISGGTPTYRVAPLPGSSTICKIVVPIPNADGTAFVGGSTFTVEGIAAGTCMIRVTDSQAKFKDVSITIGSTASVDQKPCGELTANECAQQSSRCQLIEDNCVDKTTTTVTCIAAGGEGCSSIVSNGESEIANGNSFCDTAESGSVCVKCNEGFSWDIASENCLSDNPKANGESCTHSHECF